MSFEHGFVAQSRERPGTKFVRVELAALRQGDDALRDDLVDDGRLAPVMQGLARFLKSFAHQRDFGGTEIALDEERTCGVSHSRYPRPTLGPPASTATTSRPL